MRRVSCKCRALRSVLFLVVARSVATRQSGLVARCSNRDCFALPGHAMGVVAMTTGGIASLWVTTRRVCRNNDRGCRGEPVCSPAFDGQTRGSAPTCHPERKRRICFSKKGAEPGVLASFLMTGRRLHGLFQQSRCILSLKVRTNERRYMNDSLYKTHHRHIDSNSAGR